MNRQEIIQSIKNNIINELRKPCNSFNKASILSHNYKNHKNCKLVGDDYSNVFTKVGEGFQTTQTIEVEINIPEDYDDVKLLANYNTITFENISIIDTIVHTFVSSHVLKEDSELEENKEDEDEDFMSKQPYPKKRKRRS